MSRIKKILSITLLALLALCLALAAFVAYSVFYGRAVAPARPNTVKVACVGDSITYGGLLQSQRFPSELQKLLGDAYSVGNFGAIGHTAQKAGDLPFWGHRYFRLSSEFSPDVVLIMLGTNDSKAKNWAGAERFAGDYRALIEHYQSLPSKPRVILMTPPSAFQIHGKTTLPGGISAGEIAQISDIIKTIGTSLSIPVIDLHEATASHAEFFQHDGIHPDAAGDRLIAGVIYDALRPILGIK